MINFPYDLCDRKVIQEQHLQRKQNHPYSEKSKTKIGMGLHLLQLRRGLGLFSR